VGPIDQIVTVTILTTGSTPTLPNFGTPAILCYHTHNTDFIRTYTSLTGLTSDGFLTTEPAYYMAQQILAQSPTVPSFKVIRGSVSVVQTETFQVTDTTTGDSVGLQVVGVNGTTTNLYVTVTVGQTATQIATAIAALAAPNGVTLSSATDTVTLTSSVTGKHFYAQAAKGGNFLETTPSASPATDLTNALTVDTAWYGITGEWQSSANITAIAAWAESNKRFHTYSTADTNALGASTGIGNTLKTSGYTYSFGQWGGTQIQYGALALEAQRFTSFPGTDTWAFKTLAGVTVDNLTATQITNAQGNNLNYYIAVAGVNITQVGINASGLYADLRRGIDALGAQIQTQVFGLLTSVPKEPYDPFGIAAVGGEVASAMQQFTASPNAPIALLRNDPGFQPTVILPSIANIPTIDRSARILRNVNFNAFAQNAIQTVQINGIVNM
jgi:Protein of unknown function (DUF3383)